MKRATTIWRYNLTHELAALVAAALILLIAAWFTLRDMHKRYLKARLDDVEKIHIMLNNRLADAGTAFDVFFTMPEAWRSTTEIKPLFPYFSDIFLLDGDMRVQEIYLASEKSKIFPGYLFAGGALGRLLGEAGAKPVFSSIMHGHDDDTPSLYLAARRNDQIHLARLRLDFFRDYLADYSRFSGSPAMIVSDHGYLMAVSNPELSIPSFNLARWEAIPLAARVMRAGGKSWVPVIRRSQDISGNVVVLLPMELMEGQQRSFYVFLVVLMCGMLGLLVFKNLRQKKLVAGPIARFAGKLKSIEEGREVDMHTDEAPRFQEIMLIEERFRGTALAVRQRELELMAKEKSLQSILGGLPVAVAITTLDEKQPITYTNQLFHKMFGYPPGAVNSVDDFARLAYPDEHYRSFVIDRWRGEVARARIQQQRPGTMEFTVQAADHRLLNILFSTIILDDQLLVAMVDLTPLREAERKVLHAAQREVFLANKHQQQLEAKLKSSLAASAVAHEINPPLSSILLQCKLALQRGEDYRPALEAIGSEADRVIRTIEKMRALLRNVETRHVPVNLSEIVENALLQADNKFEEHHIAVRKEGLEAVWMVSGDEIQLLVIVSNLVRNAIEAMSSLSPERLRALSISLEGGPNRVTLTVGDSGPGWSGLEPARGPLQSTKLEGSGIGLYLVQTAATMHEAEVLFGRSSLGGAEARVVFPLLAEAAEKSQVAVKDAVAGGV